MVASKTEKENESIQ